MLPGLSIRAAGKHLASIDGENERRDGYSSGSLARRDDRECHQAAAPNMVSTMTAVLGSGTGGGGGWNSGLGVGPGLDPGPGPV